MTVALALVLALAGSNASAAAPRLITRPEWLRAPNPEDPEIMSAAPMGYDGKPGSATLECRVNDVGGVGHCRVLKEDPPHHGFGRWALDIAHLFRMKPETVDGQPVSGGTVRIPVHFGSGAATIYGDALY